MGVARYANWKRWDKVARWGVCCNTRPQYESGKLSIKIMSRVWDDGPADKAEVLVLLAIADYCNDEGECWPAMDSIARKARMTERGVQKISARLVEVGWLEIDLRKGRHGCNLYRIKTPNTVHPEHSSPRTPEHQTPNTVRLNPEHSSPEPSLTVNKPSVDDNAGAGEESPKPKKARLPEGWVPTEEDVDYALSQHLTEDEIQEIANDFHAYWTDRTDAGGRKSDRGWKQTWRNRVRDQAPRYIRNRGMAGGQSPGGYGQGGSIASIVARRRAEGKV